MPIGWPKDPRPILAPLVGKTDRFIAVPIAGTENALAPERLAQRAREIGFQAVDWVADINDAPRQVPPGGRVVIVGSLYLAGNLLAENG